ncbi:MAG: HIT family protein [Alphaproteobacteria bacterium]
MTAATPEYDTENIFAQILRGEMVCHKVYEDEHTFVFMDIMPRVDGHTLVIPKAPSRNILDARPEDLAHLIATVQKIARAAKSAFSADGVTVQQFSEPAGGQVIFHTHVHILPRHDGVDLWPAGIMGDQDKIAEHAVLLRDEVTRLG